MARDFNKYSPSEVLKKENDRYQREENNESFTYRGNRFFRKIRD